MRPHRQQRVVVVGGQGVRVAGRRPPGEVPGGEQAPAAAVVQRNEGHGAVHDLLELVGRLQLRRLAGRGGQRGQRLVDRRVLETLEVVRRGGVGRYGEAAGQSDV